MTNKNMTFKYTLFLFLETVPRRYSTTLPNKLGVYRCFDTICCNDHFFLLETYYFNKFLNNSLILRCDRIGLICTYHNTKALDSGGS